MKITDKFFKNCNRIMCFFIIICFIGFEYFNPNKYIKFLIIAVFGLFSILFGTSYHLSNKLVKGKDLIGLILGNSIIVILLIVWYIRFVH